MVSSLNAERLKELSVDRLVNAGKPESLGITQQPTHFRRTAKKRRLWRAFHELASAHNVACPVIP